MDFHNHLYNVWIDQINKSLSNYLAELLKVDLPLLDNNLRVSIYYEHLLILVDKCFTLTCKYYKGCGEKFDHWLQEYYTGVLMMPGIRALGSH